MNAEAKVGRPSSYEERYCHEIVAHMADGSSVASFAASIDVARSTINHWATLHPEFSEALSRGKAKCAAWWEKQARSIAMGAGGPGASPIVIFALKNMGEDDWQEKSLIGSDPRNPLPAPVDLSRAPPEVLRWMAAQRLPDEV